MIYTISYTLFYIIFLIMLCFSGGKCYWTYFVFVLYTLANIGHINIKYFSNIGMFTLANILWISKNISQFHYIYLNLKLIFFLYLRFVANISNVNSVFNKYLYSLEVWKSLLLPIICDRDIGTSSIFFSGLLTM